MKKVAFLQKSKTISVAVSLFAVLNCAVEDGSGQTDRLAKFEHNLTGLEADEASLYKGAGLNESMETVSFRMTSGSDIPVDTSVVSFELKSNPGRRCSATIISNRHLLTAAHCVYEMLGYDKPGPRGSGYQTVYMKRRNNDGEYSVESGVAKLLVNQSWNYQTSPFQRNAHEDIGIVAFKNWVNTPSSVRWNGNRSYMYIGPIDENEDLVAWGWGATRPDGTGLGDKMNSDSFKPSLVTLDQIWSSGSNARLCKGDSGGPAMKRTRNHGTTIAGVATRFLDQGKICAEDGVSVSWARSSYLYVKIRTMLRDHFGSDFDCVSLDDSRYVRKCW